ncbi:MAG: hypothetical protein V9E87_10500 [Gemmatimonadales bacterium]
MDFDDLKAHLDRLFAPRAGATARDQAAGLREALVEFKIGIGQLREALGRTEGELTQARREAEDYARRGRLANEIGDTETVTLAEEFTAKAASRVDLLERKVLVQRDELRLAEEDYEATKRRYQSAARGIPGDAGQPLGAAAEPGSTVDESPFESYALEQRAREAAVEAQLAHLKKQLGDRAQPGT